MMRRCPRSRRYIGLNPYRKPSRKQLYNMAVINRIKEMYNTDYAAAFVEALRQGYEPGWMSEYYSTWNYLRHEISQTASDRDFYDEAYDQAHDVAISIADGLKSEGLNL